MIARGLALWISDKTPISLFDLEVVRWFGTGEILGIPSSLIVFLAVAAVGWILLNRTRYGRYVVAVGGNPEAARIAGVKAKRILFSVYVLSGICAGIAAILVWAVWRARRRSSGQLYELDAIAAVVIGGTSLAGGRATIVGTVLGVITFALVFNLLTLMNLAVEIQSDHQGRDHPRRRVAAAQTAVVSPQHRRQLSEKRRSAHVNQASHHPPVRRTGARRRRLWQRRRQRR